MRKLPGSRTMLLNEIRSTLIRDNPLTSAFDDCLISLISIQNHSNNSDSNPESNLEQLKADFFKHRNNLLASAHQKDTVDQYRTALIEAEQHRLLGNNYHSNEHYDNAITCAKVTGLLREAALTAELTARLFIDWGRSNHAVPYIDEAEDLHSQSKYKEGSAHSALTQFKTLFKPANPLFSRNRTDYKRLVEQAVDVIWSANKDGYFTYLSPQWESLLGFDPASSLGTQYISYVHPDDINSVKQAMQNLYLGNTPKNKEFRYRCADGTYIWVMVAATLIADAHGRVIGTQGILREISEKKEMEFELQNALDRLQHITENLPCIIVRHTLSEDGKYVLLYIGPQCKQLFEVEAEAALLNPKLLFQYVDPTDLSHISEKYIDSIKNRSLFHAEYRVNLPEKGVRWFQTCCKPAKLSNGEYVLDGIITDITDQKLTELELQNANSQLATAAKMKDTFIANLSHELRTPLTAIMSTNEGLQQGIHGPCTEEQLEGLEVIHESSRHLLDLINELIDLSEIEAGSAELYISDINVERICQSCFRLILSQAKAKSLKLHIQIPAQINGLQADEKRLRQILVNLLQNAIKFSPVGESIVLSAVQYRPDNTEKNCIRFSITDNGIGIEESELKTIFEPFHQVQSSLNRSYDGVGLGLALVKRFAELHSGSVYVKSKPGEGSCFCVDLPLSGQSTEPTTKKNCPPVITTEPKASTPAENTDEHRPLILLAEDNDSVARAIQRYLEFNNYRVIRANDGDSAVHMAENSKPDVVLMDIQMPRVDGIEALRRIRCVPDLKHTPIIALTGMAADADEKLCIDAGANHYLSKPYRMQTLIDLLNEMTEYATDLQPADVD